jgi:hypothetical protein
MTKEILEIAAKQDAFLTNLMTKRGLLPIEDTLTKRYLWTLLVLQITD